MKLLVKNHSLGKCSFSANAELDQFYCSDTPVAESEQGFECSVSIAKLASSKALWMLGTVKLEQHSTGVSSW